MANLARALQKIFGKTGATAEFGQVGSDAAGSPTTTKDLETIQSLVQYDGGLSDITANFNEPPRGQDINSMHYLETSQLSYLFQKGIPEWDDATEYYADVSFCQVNGDIYQALLGTGDPSNNLNKNPTTEPTYWELFSRFDIKNYATYPLTTVLKEGEIIYFNNVLGGQYFKYPVSVIGDGSSQINQLPFRERLQIKNNTVTALDVLKIEGNKISINNFSSTADIQITSTGQAAGYVLRNSVLNAFFDGTYWRIEDGAHVGEIKAFHKAIGTPDFQIPWGWKECDGTSIVDAASPLNGVTVPDLNGDERFLRGGSASGVLQDDALQGHTAKFDTSNRYVDSNGDLLIVTVSAGVDDGVVIDTNQTLSASNPIEFDGIKSDGVNGTPRIADETRPINMSVVWIIKIN